MKLISMSVYGDNPMYLQGAVLNARLLPEVYPGWTLRMYCDRRIDASEMKELGCQVVSMPISRRHSGMFWRFLAAWDPEADRVIFRDSDSRFNVREVAAVREWEYSGLNAHCMHDHPHHACYPIFGGMWGIKCGVLPRSMLKEVTIKGLRPQARVMDMKWLDSRVQPLIQSSVLRHSSIETRWPTTPFPLHEEYEGFVGQQHDGDGNPVWPK